MTMKLSKMMKLLGCVPYAQNHEIAAANPQVNSTQPVVSPSNSAEAYKLATIEEPYLLPGASDSAHINPPSGLIEDIEWAFSQAIFESRGRLGLKSDCKFLLRKPIKDDFKVLDVETVLEMPASNYLDPEVEGLEISILEEKPYAEPSSVTQSNNAREVVREILRKEMEKFQYGPTKIKSQLESEEDMYEICTLFPQYYEFERHILAQLWMAMEFVTDEKLIDCYFDALINEGYIKRARTCLPTGESMYRVNVGELNKMASTRKSLYLRVTKRDFLEKAHEGLLYLSLEHIDENSFNQIKKFKYLKGLLFVGRSAGKMHQSTEANTTKTIIEIPYDLFLTLKHLEVLDLSGVPIAELPSSIGEAKELKYLDLSFSLIEQLPETIDCLNQLQTLRLRGCHRLWKLPEGIVKLSSLRHLDLDIIGQLSFLPKHMGMLTNLETLPAFLVDKDVGRGISELKSMNNLRGRLCILRLERVSDVEKAKEATLYHKMGLDELELQWCAPRSDETKAKQHDNNVLQQLRPPSSLEHLRVSGYGGLKFPSWLNEYYFLPTLVSITLSSCENTKHLPSLGEFPCLKVVQLIGITRVRKIGVKFRGHLDIAFPALEELLIVGMSSLEKWMEWQKGDFPRLHKLIIERCPKLTAIPPVLSSLDCLKHFEISSCAKLSSLSLRRRQLTASLDLLNIQNCPSLKKRYHKKHRRDWQKIRQVRKVCIDDDQFIHNNAANVIS